MNFHDDYPISSLPIMQGILQSQGRLLRKMRFMPSSLTSNSHRLLTALVDSRHKKVYKVKNCVTDIDPEREKEQKERVIITSEVHLFIQLCRKPVSKFLPLDFLRLKVKQSELMNFLVGRRKR